MKKLTPLQHHVLIEKGTEPPFSGKYYKHKEKGTYHCAACGNKIFSSIAKFDTSCGWPSFSDANQDKIILQRDTSFGMIRTEVLCKKCKGHLGHLFNDGPQPTRQRYCINSCTLEFKKEKERKN